MAEDAYRSTNFNISLPNRARAYLASVASDPTYTGFDSLLLQNVEFIEANVDTQQVTYEFTVQSFMCNKDGNLHGGASSALFDNLSSTSLLTVSRPGFWSNFGVSRSLNVIYHAPLPEGTRVLLTCTVLAVGKRMATVRATMKNRNGTVCASCVHEKFAVQGKKL